MVAKHRALLNKLGVRDLNCGDDVTFTKFPFELVEHTSDHGRLSLADSPGDILKVASACAI
uniref:Uncharacterized protein n=1 Tax=Glossina morsitans morsitans TaxID=37546 RepID=A0A1B0G9F1_GLOMM